MPFRRTILLSLATLLALFQGSASANSQERHVLVISMDGLPAYLLDDPKASMPTLRRLMKQGSYAAQGMSVSNPSVTWPNHTSMMTGVHAIHHGVLFNGTLVRDGLGLPVRVDGKRTQQELVQVPMLFDRLKAAGLRTAAINWPCTSGSSSVDDNFPDVPDTLEHSTPKLIQELTAAGILDPETFGKLSTVGRDEVWTEATCHVIRERRPHLLALHLLNIDAVHHTYGPQSLAGYTAVAAADMMVARVLEAVEAAGLTATTSVFIVSDHGFTPIPKSLLPNVALRKAGLLTVEGTRVTSARVHVFPEGGIGMLYCTVPDTREQDLAAAIELFQSSEGIEEILRPSQFAEHNLPLPGDHPGMADLVLVAKDGYGFNGRADGEESVTAAVGTPGTHGFLSRFSKMNATFIASGAGIRHGRLVEPMSNIDVAPTVATLLGISLGEVDGQTLKNILTP